MIATDRLLFLHLHKSGGTFVNALLMQCVPSAREIGYHLPYREAPAEVRGLPVVGTVRSPWDYYVSWFHFQRDQRKPNILFQLCSDRGHLGFKDTTRNLVQLASDEEGLAYLEQHLPDSFADHGVNLTKSCLRQLRETGLGFYSFLYHRLYEGAEDPTIIRMEELRQELRIVLERLGHMPDECADRFLREVPPLNRSKHDPATAYYDEALSNLIAERDSMIIARHGYSL